MTIGLAPKECPLSGDILLLELSVSRGLTGETWGSSTKLYSREAGVSRDQSLVLAEEPNKSCICFAWPDRKSSVNDLLL